MSAGPRIPVQLQIKIKSTYERMREKNPSVEAKEVARFVRNQLTTRPSGAGPNWPSDSAVRRILAPLRQQKTALKADIQDKPWSLLSMSFKPIDADALPAVLDVWAHSVVENQPLTIRQARWVSRLHRLYAGRTAALWHQATRLADNERWFDPRALYPDKVEGAEWLWVEDCFLYNHRVGNKASNEAVNKALRRMMVKAHPALVVDVDEDGNPMILDAVQRWWGDAKEQ